ncbi:MAG: DUF1992 domain-containing protein [Caldilineaceae bacterium]
MTEKRLQAKENVRNYQEVKAKDGAEVPTEDDTLAREPLPRTEQGWDDLISHRIEEAIRNGAFDNLRGKGKPLQLNINPFVPDDQQMANSLLQNNNLAPQWITDRTAILAAIETFRAKFQERAHGWQAAWRTVGQTAAEERIRQEMREEWSKQLATWQQEVSELNKRINNVNLQQPIARLEIFKVILDEELTRVGMSRSLSN